MGSTGPRGNIPAQPWTTGPRPAGSSWASGRQSKHSQRQDYSSLGASTPGNATQNSHRTGPPLADGNMPRETKATRQGGGPRPGGGTCRCKNKSTPAETRPRPAGGSRPRENQAARSDARAQLAGKAVGPRQTNRRGRTQDRDLLEAAGPGKTNQHSRKQDRDPRGQLDHRKLSVGGPRITTPRTSARTPKERPNKQAEKHTRK
jgi:hypothetical protein